MNQNLDPKSDIIWTVGRNETLSKHSYKPWHSLTWAKNDGLEIKISKKKMKRRNEEDEYYRRKGVKQKTRIIEILEYGVGKGCVG